MFKGVFGRRRGEELPGETVPMVKTQSREGRRTFNVRVWVHECRDEQFVHPSMVMDMLRGMMEGPAAPTFCDAFELTLRRALDNARGDKQGLSGLPKQQEVATVGAERESL